MFWVYLQEIPPAGFVWKHLHRASSGHCPEKTIWMGFFQWKVVVEGEYRHMHSLYVAEVIQGSTQHSWLSEAVSELSQQIKRWLMGMLDGFTLYFTSVLH